MTRKRNQLLLIGLFLLGCLVGVSSCPTDVAKEIIEIRTKTTVERLEAEVPSQPYKYLTPLNMPSVDVSFEEALLLRNGATTSVQVERAQDTIEGKKVVWSGVVGNVFNVRPPRGFAPPWFNIVVRQEGNHLSPRFVTFVDTPTVEDTIAEVNIGDRIEVHCTVDHSSGDLFVLEECTEIYYWPSELTDQRVSLLSGK